MASQLLGLPSMLARIKSYQRAFPDRVASALRIEAEIEMTESKRRCPVDVTPPMPHPGQLRASGRVEIPERRGSRISVELTYGTDYAVFVHENLDNYHPVGEAKFLESVLNESAPHMAQRLAQRLKASER